jgi:hypothetical protein
MLMAAGPVNEMVLLFVAAFDSGVFFLRDCLFPQPADARRRGLQRERMPALPQHRGVGGHKGPDLSGVGRRKSKAEMRQQIVYGSKVMPAFGDDLEPDELKDLIAYCIRAARNRRKPHRPPIQTRAGHPSSHGASNRLAQVRLPLLAAARL